MTGRRVLVLLLAILAAVQLALMFPPGGTPLALGAGAPEFTHREAHEWINSPPISLRSLRGQVVLIDFWTFDCWNCYRSFPWLNALDRRYSGQGLQIIGVHSPEFDRERERDRVAEKVGEFGLEHPTMIDNDFSYWRAMGNRYWPAFYLIDKHGRLRYRYAGETHTDDPQAREIEGRLQELLAEEL